MYIFPDNWTASIIEQNCWYKENVFRSHLYNHVVAILSSSLPLITSLYVLKDTYCFPKADMTSCFKFYVLLCSFPWHYSDSMYPFSRSARVVRALYRFVPYRSGRSRSRMLSCFKNPPWNQCVFQQMGPLSSFRNMSHLLHFMHLFKTLISQSVYTKPPVPTYPRDCYVHWTCLSCLW